jgi:hypothetical protein
LKNTLIVFFLPKFIIHRNLKNALERQQGKWAHANAIATQGFEDRKNHPLLTMRSSKRWKNIDRGNTPSNAGLQSVITKPEGWRNRNLTKNISEKEIKTAPTKDSQTDLAEPTLTVSLALRRHQKERRRGREKPKKPYSIASSSPTPCYVTKNQTEKKN